MRKFEKNGHFRKIFQFYSILTVFKKRYFMAAFYVVSLIQCGIKEIHKVGQGELNHLLFNCKQLDDLIP